MPFLFLLWIALSNVALHRASLSDGLLDRLFGTAKVYEMPRMPIWAKPLFGCVLCMGIWWTAFYVLLNHYFPVFSPIDWQKGWPLVLAGMVVGVLGSVIDKLIGLVGGLSEYVQLQVKTHVLPQMQSLQLQVQQLEAEQAEQMEYYQAEKTTWLEEKQTLQQVLDDYKQQTEVNRTIRIV